MHKKVHINNPDVFYRKAVAALLQHFTRHNFHVMPKGKKDKNVIYSNVLLPKDRMLSSAVILASASSSSCVRGRSRWAPRRLRGASWRSCKRKLVFRVCSLVDWRTDFRAKEWRWHNTEHDKLRTYTGNEQYQNSKEPSLVFKRITEWLLNDHTQTFLEEAVAKVTWHTRLSHNIYTGGHFNCNFLWESVFAEILLSPKSWNSCGILRLSSTFVFSVFFCSSEGLFGFGLTTFIGSLGRH